MLPGQFFVLSGPSGVGKTTIAQCLLRDLPRLERSISCTTRPPRPDERDGRDYFFVSPARFRRLIEQRALFEWARVFGHYYGTPREHIEKRLRAGVDLLLVIDVQGAAQLRRQRATLSAPVTFIFVLPPSWGALQERLSQRRSESATVRRLRLETAHRELAAATHFDFLVVNRQLDLAVAASRQLILSSHANVRDDQWLDLRAEGSSPLINRAMFS